MLLKITRTTEWYVDLSDDPHTVQDLEEGKDVDLATLITEKGDQSNKNSYKAKFVAHKVVRKTAKPTKSEIGFKE